MFDDYHSSILNKILLYTANLLDTSITQNTTNGVNTSNVHLTLDIIKYKSLSAFKESVNNGNLIKVNTQTKVNTQMKTNIKTTTSSVVGNKNIIRHEVQLDKPEVTKGYITVYINGYGETIQLFYHCNLKIGLFRMWKLHQTKITTWLTATEKQIYSDTWLDNIVCLWLFNVDKNVNNYVENQSKQYYMFQWSADKHQTSAIGVFRERNRHQVEEHDTDGIYHIYFAKMTYFRLPMTTMSNKVVGICIRECTYYLDCCHKVFLFENGKLFLTKHIDTNVESDIIVYTECNIQNDKYHGQRRQWVNFDEREKSSWLNYQKHRGTPVDEFKTKLIGLTTFHDGKHHGVHIQYHYHVNQVVSNITHYHHGVKHGLASEYNKYGNIVNTCDWHHDQKHGWDVGYKYNNVGGEGSEHDNIDEHINDDESSDHNDDNVVDDDNNVVDDDEYIYNENYGDVIVRRHLYYFGECVLNYRPLIYLGLYVLQHDGYVVCHDKRVNSFLSCFDMTPPEIMEHILMILCGCTRVRINKFFTSAGIDLCQKIMS